MNIKKIFNKNHLLRNIILFTFTVVIMLVLFLKIGHKSYNSWYGIIPGHSTIEKSLAVLGEPDLIEQRDGYLIYIYNDKYDLGGWKDIEIWISNDGKSQVIQAIYRSAPDIRKSDGRLLSIADINSASMLLQDYGRPDFVTWSTRCLRYLIWTEYGIAASVDPTQYILFDWEINVNSILLFEPMTLIQFQQTNWPWNPYEPSIENESTCLLGDLPDPYPEDPFDWKNSPTSVP